MNSSIIYRKAATPKLKVGDWDLVYFPQDETGEG